MKRKTDDDIILHMLDEGHSQKEIAEHFGVSPAAICKRVARLSAYPKTLNELTPKEQRFALSVAEGKSQTQSAIDAYNVSSYESAKALGSQLMKKPEINASVAEWMNYHGLNRSYRVGKLRQHVDHRDPNVSLNALDQSWKLDSGYRENLVHVPVSYEELQASIEHERAIQRECAIEIEKIEKEEAELLKELKAIQAKDKASAKPKKTDDE